MTEEVFKQIQLLRGIPDTFFDAMGMFANAMGNDCTFCHVSKAYFDKAAFAEQTPRMQRARQMIVMMNAINKQLRWTAARHASPAIKATDREAIQASRSTGRRLKIPTCVTSRPTSGSSRAR